MRLVILGAGGHGRVVAEAARSATFDVIGFLDEDPAKMGLTALNLQVLGDTALLETGRIACDGVALGIGRNAIRQELHQRFHGRFALPAIIHQRAWVSPSAIVGDASVVMANATIQTACRLGRAVIINTNASVDHDCVLGDGVHVAPGAHLAGGITVGKGTHIGIGASVIEGIHIGTDCLIAAGAVVVRDVPDGHRVAGVPARVMK